MNCTKRGEQSWAKLTGSSLAIEVRQELLVASQWSFELRGGGIGAFALEGWWERLSLKPFVSSLMHFAAA